MRVRALDRVGALHPEWKDCDVKIRCTQSKGSSIISVAAIGAEPKYTRVFLDALLDEYMAFYREQSPDSELVAIMERPGPAVEEQPALWLPLGIAAGVGFGAGLVVILLIATLASIASPRRSAPPPLS